MDHLAELLAALESISELSAEELAALEADLVAAADELLDGDASDAQIEALEQVAAALEQVRGEAVARDEAAAERQARAEALRDRIKGEQAPEEGEDEDDKPPADDQSEDDSAEAEDREAVAASAGSVVRAPRIGRVAARRPASAAPKPASLNLPDHIADWGLVAAANAPNISAGQPIRSYDQLAGAFIAAWQATSAYVEGPPTSVRIARAGARSRADEVYGSDRTLDDNPVANYRKIDAVTSPGAITAAGGICAPINVAYDMPTLGSTARPVRDQMMARFGADRGGVRTIPAPIITDVTNAIGFWTEQNDRTPGTPGPATKPCLTITCPDDDETLVYAVTQCIRTGNFRQRFFPEQVQAWLRLAAVSQARQAEIRLLTSIGAASAQVTYAQQLGATRDVLAVLDQATARYRSRYRLDVGTRLRFGAPFWLLHMLRTDLAREMPGAADERLAMADGQIENFFRIRGVNVTWFLDGEAGQIFGAQEDGELVNYPTTVITYLYPEGEHLFLDGGSLDLGVVRDSTLNATNDVMFFSETFEGHHHLGGDSLRIEMTICPDGTTSGTADITPCAVAP